MDSRDCVCEIQFYLVFSISFFNFHFNIVTTGNQLANSGDRNADFRFP